MEYSEQESLATLIADRINIPEALTPKQLLTGVIFAAILIRGDAGSVDGAITIAEEYADKILGEAP